MYQYHKLRWMKHMDFMVLDIVLFELAMLVSILFRFGTLRPADGERFVRSALLLLVIDLLHALLSKNYSGVLRREFSREGLSTLSFTSVIMGELIAVLYVFRVAEAFPRTVYLMTWGLGTIFIAIGRWVLKKYIQSRPDANRVSRRILVITNTESAEEVLSTLNTSRQGSFLIDSVCIVDEDLRGQIIEETTVSSFRNDLFAYIRSTEIEEVFIHLPHDRNRATFLTDHLKDMGITVHMSLSWQSTRAERNTMVENFGGFTVLTSSLRIVTVGQMAIKRTMDIVGSIIGIAICIVVTIFVAPVIYFQSPGPIFFAQERIGKNGKRFKLYKFRSMYPNADAMKADLMDQNEVEDGMMFKMTDDPRIFPFGNFMRRTSIDELPQFFNVLIGNMSLVGTRPPTVDEWEKYDFHHMKRLAIKPGITGLWQTSGRSEITDFNEVVALDTQYIDEWSIWYDVKLLLKTVVVVFKRSGAK